MEAPHAAKNMGKVREVEDNVNDNTYIIYNYLT